MLIKRGRTESSFLTLGMRFERLLVAFVVLLDRFAAMIISSFDLVWTYSFNFLALLATERPPLGDDCPVGRSPSLYAITVAGNASANPLALRPEEKDASVIAPRRNFCCALAGFVCLARATVSHLAEVVLKPRVPRSPLPSLSKGPVPRLSLSVVASSHGPPRLPKCAGHYKLVPPPQVEARSVHPIG
jgi:hypothetical protein